MANHAMAHEVRNPGPYRISPMAKMLYFAAAFIGIVTFLAGLKFAPTRVWPSFLHNYFYFMTLALSGVFFTALQHITNAAWSVTVRRVAEGLMCYLVIALVLGVVLFLGRHELYEWTHQRVMNEDHVLQLKSNYLNSKFFALRLFGGIALWIAFGFAMRGNSVKQDVSGDEKLTLANVKLGTIFMPIFAVTYTLISFDLLMSLEPHWFSTIYGVIRFASLFVTGLALLAVLVINGRKQGLFSSELINENHLHDIGKLMFAFTVFWGYTMFSQLMLIWYANLPEETVYYSLRFNAGWWPVACTVFTVCFLIPFFGLLPRGAKRCEGYLKKMSLFILFAHWLDLYIMVYPPLFKSGPVFGWVEAGIALGFLGLFGTIVGRSLESRPAIPLKDPRMAQCLAHHQ